MEAPFIPENIVFCTDVPLRAIDCMPEGYQDENISVFMDEPIVQSALTYKRKTLVFIDEKESFEDTDTTVYYPVKFDLLGLDDHSKKDVPQVLALCGILGKDETDKE